MDAAINRVEELYRNWEHLQKRLEESGLAHESTLKQVKYDYLKRGLWRIATDATQTEKIYLRVLSSLSSRLQRELHPKRGLLLRTFYYLKVNLIDRPAYLTQHLEAQQFNFSSLKNELTKSGFTVPSGLLGRNLVYERPAVQLRMTSQLKDQRTLDVQLSIEKDANGFYRLAEYKATLISLAEAFEPRSIVVRGGEFTITEAVSLLEGKAHLQNVQDHT